MSTTWKPQCDSCRRHVEARYEILEQRICNACYTRLRWNASACPACAQTKVLAFRSPDGLVVCAACAGVPSRFGCATCGSEQHLTGSHCGRCRLENRLGNVLSDPTGQIHPELASLREHLLTARDPRSATRWLRHEPIDRTLRAMAQGKKPVSHHTLNELPQSTRVRYFRHMLISSGTLPDIDVRLNDLELRTKALTGSLPPAHAAIITRYFNWEILRRLRRRPVGQPISAGVVNTRTAEIRKIAAFLAWLDNHGQPLAALEQVTLDHYLSRRNRHKTLASFLNWAVRNRITPRLRVPRKRPSPPPAPIPEDVLWDKVDGLLNDESIPLPSRIIGLLLLVFAQPIRDSVRLRREDVHRNGEVFSLKFGSTPIELPAPITDLLRRHLDETRARQPYVGEPSGWLFDGTMPHQHTSEGGIALHLARQGIRAREVKRARLDQLAQVLPASIVADVTGITVETALRHAINTNATWGIYPELRASEPGQFDANE